MADRDIASIVWHEQGHRIDVKYFEGDAEHFSGSRDVAAVLAREEGLGLVPTPEDTVRWARDPDTRSVKPGDPA
jgi:hypothetical protein